MVIVSTPENKIVVHRYENATPLVLLAGDSLEVPIRMCFLEDGEKAVGVGSADSLCVWDARDGHHLQTLDIGPRISVETMTVSHYFCPFDTSLIMHRVSRYRKMFITSLSLIPAPGSIFGQRGQCIRGALDLPSNVC